MVAQRDGVAVVVVAAAAAGDNARVVRRAAGAARALDVARGGVARRVDEAERDHVLGAVLHATRRRAEYAPSA